MQKVLKLKIASSTSCLSFLRELLDKLEMPERMRQKCVLALVEAVDNAIFHAHKNDESIPIDIKVSYGEKKAVLEVKDKGEGFDIDEVPVPSLDQINGRGIFIVKKLMKKVEYKNNTLRMTYEERN